jgi:hypothetical protein
VNKLLGKQTLADHADGVIGRRVALCERA